MLLFTGDERIAAGQGFPENARYIRVAVDEGFLIQELHGVPAADKRTQILL